MSFAFPSWSRVIPLKSRCAVEARAKGMPWTLFAVRDQVSGLIVVRDADVKPYETRTVGTLTVKSVLRDRLERELRVRQRVYFRYDHRGQLILL